MGKKRTDEREKISRFILTRVLLSTDFINLLKQIMILEAVN